MNFPVKELERFKKAQTSGYQRKFDEILLKLTKKIGLIVAHQKPIHRKNRVSWSSVKNKPVS